MVEVVLGQAEVEEDVGVFGVGGGELLEDGESGYVVVFFEGFVRLLEEGRIRRGWLLGGVGSACGELGLGLEAKEQNEYQKDGEPGFVVGMCGSG